MNTDMQTAPRPLQHRIRLLLPFFLDRNALCEAERHLIRGFHQAGKPPAFSIGKPSLAARPALSAGFGVAGKIWPCWKPADEIPRLYQDETLPSVQAFLFGKESGCCGYFRVPDQTADFWFKRGGILAKEGGGESRDGRPTEFPLRLADPGIELFLSPHGAGVLSVAFEPKEIGDLLFLREFNYRLSQVRDFTAYRFGLPLGERNPNPPPNADAPLAQRLGQAGGSFTLIEWAEFLLEPLQALGYRRVQEQFSVYSATGFDASVVFTDAAVQAELRPYLAALAHVEEYDHPGSLDIAGQMLNPRHWTAVGSLGAAHLVANQGLEFDKQRLPVVLHKYFVGYLLALLQRTTLLRILEDARTAITDLAACDGELVKNQSQLVERVRSLNSHTLAFTVNGFFTEASSREAHNQCYALAQQGLRVRESFATLRRALHDAEIMDNDRFQNRALVFQGNALNQLGTLAREQQRAIANLEVLVAKANASVGIVAHVQSKVEWLEVFFVSYYATALVYYLMHSGFMDEDYASFSLLFAPLVSGGLAFWKLRPDKLHKHGEPKPEAGGETQGRRSCGFMAALVFAFLAWLATGMGIHGYRTGHWMPSHEAESSATHSAQGQTPVTESAPAPVPQPPDHGQPGGQQP